MFKKFIITYPKINLFTRNITNHAFHKIFQYWNQTAIAFCLDLKIINRSFLNKDLTSKLSVINFCPPNDKHNPETAWQTLHGCGKKHLSAGLPW